MNTEFDKVPIVSVIIPNRNEERYITDCLDSLLSQKGFENEIEILVVDGMSIDKTRAMVNQYVRVDHRVKLLDNPKKITPSAMNIGIKAAKGEFIAILGAHTKYSEDYLAGCLALIKEHPEVMCVGGPITSYGQSHFGKATALAMSNKIGVGNAKHRFSNYSGYAEGACFPFFKREVFSKTGLYDENLVRNQDDEFNYRMRKLNLKIFISNKVKSVYFVRETPMQLFKQYFEYGYWRVAVIKKHAMPASFRQLAPIIFFFSLIMLIIIAPFTSLNPLLIGSTLPVIYFLAVVFVGLRIMPRHGFIAGMIFPLPVFIMHFSYAFGFFRGIFKFYFGR